MLGGVNKTIGLCGYNQAMALAYAYAAIHDADPNTSIQKIAIRIQPYEVKYDIKAKKLPVEDA
jgi:hypothetical protein|tara:strand:+ start:3523 stop:3711 length:189 start_codon:yes stop_codon:yes gene_type:complete